MSEHVTPVNGRPTDPKGRVRVDEMTDREIVMETLVMLRAVGDALEAASQNPMLRAMIPGGF